MNNALGCSATRLHSLAMGLFSRISFSFLWALIDKTKMLTEMWDLKCRVLPSARVAELKLYKYPERGSYKHRELIRNITSDNILHNGHHHSQHLQVLQHLLLLSRPGQQYWIICMNISLENSRNSTSRKEKITNNSGTNVFGAWLYILLSSWFKP